MHRLPGRSPAIGPAVNPSLPPRRAFLRFAGAAAATAPLASVLHGVGTPAVSGSAGSPPAKRSAQRFPLCGLEKHFFEKYSAAQTAQAYADIGIEIELTVRPEGHIKPAHAAEEMPLLAAALAEKGRRILIVASSFVRPDEPHVEGTLRTMKTLGIGYYRHRGFKYVPGRSLKEQIASFRSQAREFAAMNREIGVQALYQNHAGADYAGAAIWDLDLILDDIDPGLFGVALDTRHLLVELGRAWPTGIRLIAPRIGALFVKSFRWEHDRTVETSLAEGIVTAAMVNQIVADRPQLPISIHVEYRKFEAVPFAERSGIVADFRSDAGRLREWLGLV